jgi:hypothetical protein
MIKLKNILNESTPDQVIKDLDKAKNDLLKKVDALIAKKKKLYSDVDIEAPMSADEKKLDKDIADLFSQINKLVLQKRSIKKESVNEENQIIGKDAVKYFIDTYNNPTWSHAKITNWDINAIGSSFDKLRTLAKQKIKNDKANGTYKPIKLSNIPNKLTIESVNEAKVVKVKFNDNDQTLYFSDGEKAKVDYDGEFKYKGKWFDTSDMSSSKDLEKMLAKAFPGTKFIQTESAKSDKLASLINNSIDKVDSSLSYKDFAMAIGKILKDEYGSHLYSMFVQELNKELKRENESIKLGSLMIEKSNNSIKETFTQSIRNLFSELVPKEVYNARTPQEIEKKKTFVRDLVKTLNNFYRQHGVDWKFADTDFKFKMYSKN